MTCRRENESEDSAGSILAFSFDGAAMFLNNSVCNGEAKAGAVSDTLGRKKRIKNLA